MTPLSADNYFAWSNDMEIVLRGKGLPEYVKGKVCQQNIALPEDSAKDSVNKMCTEVDEQNRDLALAYILTSIDSYC